MIFTLNLRTLRPLRLCGRYSEFRLRLSRTGSFVVNISNFVSVGLVPVFAHARQRRLKEPLGFVDQFLRRPLLFVHALTFVVRTDWQLLALRLRHARAVDFEVIAVGIIKINLGACCARACHRSDERHLPFFKMLRPFRQVFGRRIECQMRMGLIPIGLAVALLEEIDLEAGARRTPVCKERASPLAARSGADS